jgi:hypothetical protein
VWSERKRQRDTSNALLQEGAPLSDVRSVPVDGAAFEPLPSDHSAYSQPFASDAAPAQLYQPPHLPAPSSLRGPQKF